MARREANFCEAGRLCLASNALCLSAQLVILGKAKDLGSFLPNARRQRMIRCFAWLNMNSGTALAFWNAPGLRRFLVLPVGPISLGPGTSATRSRFPHH
jgi:hypothetical protein